MKCLKAELVSRSSDHVNAGSRDPHSGMVRFVSSVGRATHSDCMERLEFPVGFISSRTKVRLLIWSHHTTSDDGTHTQDLVRELLARKNS